METEQLEENVSSLLKDVEEARPKRGGPFITWVWCEASPSPERFKISHESYITTKNES